MSYVLALVLVAVAAFLVLVMQSERPHARHAFIFEMLAQIEPGNVVAGFKPSADQDPKAAVLKQHRAA